VNRARAARRPSRALRAQWPALVVWLLILAYVLFFGTLTVRQHDAFETTAFDLGNVDQAVWNTRHGRPFAMTNIEGLENRLGTHVEPILLPISLLYFVWSDPRTLLLLQTVVIALGAWPVYKLANLQIGKYANQKMEKWTNGQSAPPDVHASAFADLPIGRLAHAHILCIAFVAAYLLFPALQSANVFDFHAVALAPTFFLAALYFLERERWGWYALFAILTMSCKEDMPLLVAMLGLYALVIRRRWVVGLATMGVAGTWFLLAVGWVMPHFDTRGVSPIANRYAYLGDGPVEMATTMFTRPGVVLARMFTVDNIIYVAKLLAPVAFLPLLAPEVLLMAVPPLAVNLLSTDGFMHELEGFHYGAPLVPVVVAAAIYGAGRLLSHISGTPRQARRIPRTRILSLLLTGVLLLASLGYHWALGYTPLAVNFAGTWPAVTAHDRLGHEIARGIPADASLAAPPYPNPHASQRQQLHMIDRVEDGLPAPLRGTGQASPAGYVWLDVTDSWPLHPNDLKRGADNLLAGEYGVETAVDGWLLLRRGAPAKTLPGAFYDFARAPDAKPDYGAHLTFAVDGAPALELLGFDLHTAPGDQRYSATFYWRALQPLPADLRLYPFLFDDDDGRIVEDTTLRPMIATVWYPPARWAVGEVIQTSMLPWGVGPDFSLGVGVMQGDDWSAVGQRLPITVESSDLIVRLFDGDTWARLVHVTDSETLEEARSFATPAPEHPLDVDLGSRVRLLGYDLACNRRARTCEVTLYWQAQQRLETSYTVFAQMLGPGGVATQADAVPRGGGYPTVWWLPGEVVADSLVLELPPGAGEVTYRLIVGLYDPLTGNRLTVTGTGADFVELETVEP
jgi:uncharacterized membrane protein